MMPDAIVMFIWINYPFNSIIHNSKLSRFSARYTLYKHTLQMHL